MIPIGIVYLQALEQEEMDMCVNVMCGNSVYPILERVWGKFVSRCEHSLLNMLYHSNVRRGEAANFLYFDETHVGQVPAHKVSELFPLILNYVLRVGTQTSEDWGRHPARLKIHRLSPEDSECLSTMFEYYFPGSYADGELRTTVSKGHNDFCQVVVYSGRLEEFPDDLAFNPDLIRAIQEKRESLRETGNFVPDGIIEKFEDRLRKMGIDTDKDDYTGCEIRAVKRGEPFVIHCKEDYDEYGEPYGVTTSIRLLSDLQQKCYVL